MRVKFLRVLVLILILCFVAIIFSPSSRVSADCATSGTQTITVENGLISAPTLAPFKVAPTAGVSCVGDTPRARIPQIALTSYTDMKTLYYDQATCTNCKFKDTATIDLTGNNKLYWMTNGLSLDSNITVGKTGVVFVDGDLFINSNQTGDTDTTGLVFIVQGTIYIAPTVETVNAFMINYGGFCSAYQSGTPPICQDNDNTANQKFLTINGSVISLGSTAPSFVRQKYTLTTPAETIKYEPKYLVILKDIFARDLKIWHEVQ